MSRQSTTRGTPLDINQPTVPMKLTGANGAVDQPWMATEDYRAVSLKRTNYIITEGKKTRRPKVANGSRITLRLIEPSSEIVNVTLDTNSTRRQDELKIYFSYII